MRQATAAVFALGGVLVVLLEGMALASWQGWWPRKPQPGGPAFQAVDVEPHPEPIPPPVPEEPATSGRPVDAYYSALRGHVQWIPAKVGRQVLLTPDPPSRMLLAKSAARRARLHEVGLGFEDVYGIIDAESSWVPRDGASRDGTPNLGIAQFEPATAKALGVRDPHDVVEAVHAAAQHMREAAIWSAGRIARLGLSREERADRLRDGVSVYYNLSTRGRALWDGRSKARLPAATRAHIRNTRLGARQAAQLEAQWHELERSRPLALREPLPDLEAVLTASAEPVRADMPEPP